MSNEIPTMPAPEEPAGPTTPEEDEGHPWTRFVTVAIVLVSLAIAAVGYLQVTASSSCGEGPAGPGYPPALNVCPP